MLRQGLLEQPSLRLLLACALSLAVHALLILHLPFDLAQPATSSAPHKTRMSVVFSAPHVPASTKMPASTKSVSRSQELEPPSPAIELPGAAPTITQPARQPLPVETLRRAWRGDAALEQEQRRSMRLTDDPGLGAEARAYLASWQREVQRIGQLNFPTDEQGRRLRGSLRLLVGIRPDGSLAYARITASSGKARLDAAAIRIVELAAPFAPLPRALRRGDSPLEIERTWRIGASLVQF